MIKFTRIKQVLIMLVLMIAQMGVFANVSSAQNGSDNSAKLNAYEKGMVLYKANKFILAEPLLKQIMEYRPDDIDGEMNYGILLFKLQKYKEASKVFEHVTLVEPDNAAAWGNIGNCYSHLSDFEQAERCYRKASDFEPTNAKYLSNVSNMLSKLGKYEDAKVFANRAVKANPKSFFAWSDLSQAEAFLSDYKNAATHCKQAMTLCSNPGEAQKMQSFIAHLELQAKRSASEQQSAVDYLKQINPEKWNVTNPIRVYIYPGLSVRGYKPEYLPMLKSCFQEWSDATNGGIRFEYVSSPKEGQILCRWTANQSDMTTSSEYGISTIVINANHTIKSSEVILLSIPVWKNEVITSEKARFTALHEVGHSLGIRGHSLQAGDIMFDLLAFKPRTHLSARDVRPIQLMYPMAH